ncbi:MAG: MarR family winged helix-turn-helix transcriptional regulator [Pseudolactococcus laudensis]
MSEQTNVLLELFSKLLQNPQMRFALRTHAMNHHFSQAGGDRRRQGARGLFNLLLKEDGLTNTEIAEKLDIRPSSVTNMVKQLEAEAFIVRKQDEQDKRVSRIFLTENARMAKDKQSQFSDTLSETLLGDLTPEEVLTLSNLLRKIIETNQTFPEELSEFEHFSNHHGASNRELNHIRMHERRHLNKERARERNQESFDETFRRFAKSRHNPWDFIRNTRDEDRESDEEKWQDF